MDGWEIKPIFAKINDKVMTEHIVINHPSKKLDEFMYKLGVAKHERLEALKEKALRGELHYDKIVYLNE